MGTNWVGIDECGNIMVVCTLIADFEIVLNTRELHNESINLDTLSFNASPPSGACVFIFVAKYCMKINALY